MLSCELMCSLINVLEKPVWCPKGRDVQCCVAHDTEDALPYMRFGFCIPLISAHAIGYVQGPDPTRSSARASALPYWHPMQDRCLQLHPYLQLGRLLRQPSLLTQFQSQNHSDPSYMSPLRAEKLSPGPPWNRAVQEAVTRDKTQGKRLSMIMQH